MTSRAFERCYLAHSKNACYGFLGSELPLVLCEHLKMKDFGYFMLTQQFLCYF